MKANLYSIVLMAGAMISSVNAFAQPTTSAPTPPELAKSKVISIYSDAYASTGFEFGVWGSGSTYALEKIGDTDNVAKFTTTDLGYFGWQFGKVNTAAMDKLHVDVYGDAAFSVRVVPITGGTEVGQTIEVSAGKWTSVDLDTKVFADGGANLANVYQIKFDNVKSQTFYIDNVYFWSTSTDVDTEAPSWVSAPTVVANSTSATISVNANDNVSTTLTYEVSKTADFVAPLEATVNGKANEATEIALKGLSPKTDYTYYVRVKDMAGNVGDVKTVTFTTTAQAAVVATYYGVFYTNDWEEKAKVGEKEVAPQINWKAETLEGYNDVIVTAELSEALPDGAALKFYAFIEGGVGQVYDNDMTATGKANEYTIKLSEVLPKGKTLEKDQIFSQFFFRLYPTGEGVFSRTKILSTYKVGASNDPIATDTKAPEWGVDPVAEKVTDKTAEIVINVTDDSGSAVITLTGDNGFVEVKKTVKADGTKQTIALNGLTANTTYNLTLAIADAAGNAGESKTVKFTTLETPDREVLYHSFDFTSDKWKKNGDSNTFAPNGNILLTVNADNTVTVKVTVDEGAETVDNAWVILHGIGDFRINAQEDGSFVGTSTNSISNREDRQAFHLNFVLKGVAKNSELDVMYFTPSEGSTSAVAEVETEAAKVVAANGVIRVEGDKTFAVYTVAGQLAFRGMGEVRLDKGVYVVVVDGKAQKVML